LRQNKLNFVPYCRLLAGASPPGGGRDKRDDETAASGRRGHSPERWPVGLPLAPERGAEKRETIFGSHHAPTI